MTLQMLKVVAAKSGYDFLKANGVVYEDRSVWMTTVDYTKHVVQSGERNDQSTRQVVHVAFFLPILLFCPVMDICGN